jgi:hypothetical protein
MGNPERETPPAREIRIGAARIISGRLRGGGVLFIIIFFFYYS